MGFQKFWLLLLRQTNRIWWISSTGQQTSGSGLGSSRNFTLERRYRSGAFMDPRTRRQVAREPRNKYVAKRVEVFLVCGWIVLRASEQTSQGQPWQMRITSYQHGIKGVLPLWHHFCSMVPVPLLATLEMIYCDANDASLDDGTFPPARPQSDAPPTCAAWRLAFDARET